MIKILSITYWFAAAEQVVITGQLVVHILYLEPFSKKIKDELKRADKIIVVENNSTSQLSRLLAEKTQIIIEDKNKILRYDGRPFLYDELAEEIKARLR